MKLLLLFALVAIAIAQKWSPPPGWTPPTKWTKPPGWTPPAGWAPKGGKNGKGGKVPIDFFAVFHRSDENMSRSGVF